MGGEQVRGTAMPLRVRAAARRPCTQDAKADAARRCAQRRSDTLHLRVSHPSCCTPSPLPHAAASAVSRSRSRALVVHAPHCRCRCRPGTAGCFMSAASAAFLLGAAACLLCLLPLLLLFPALRWRATAALHTLAPARLGVGAMFSFFSRSAAPAAAPSSRAGEHHPGLRNTGNTCYLNSVLQSLASLPGLTRFLLQLEADAEAEDVGTAVRDGLAEVLGGECRPAHAPSTPLTPAAPASAQLSARPPDCTAAVSPDACAVEPLLGRALACRSARAAGCTRALRPAPRCARIGRTSSGRRE